MKIIKNKSLIFICIVTTLMLLFLTGYSAWVIINVKDNDTSPTYNYRDIIISAYKDNQSKVYNKGQLGPDAYIDGEIDTDNLIDVDQYEFYHRVQGSTDWVEDLPTNSGTYDIKIINKADPNPDNPIIITFTINKAQPTLTAEDINTFVSNDYEIKYLYNGDSEDVLIEYYDGETKIDKPTTAGTYKAIISISEGSNYLSVSKEININISDTLVIGPEHIQEIGTVEYEGSQIKPEPTIIVNENVLVKDVDYEISYGDNLNVGPGSFTVIGKGNYGGEVTQYFTIGWKYLTPQDLAINYNATYRTFDQIKTNQILTNTTNDTGDIVSGLILKDSSGNIYGGESLISITNMHNGLYGYGTFEVNPSPYTATTNVVGSTYYVSISITNDNYKLTEDYFILKYQTVKIDNTGYYTIEDAIVSNSGVISLYGDATTASSYVETTFTSLPSEYSPYANASTIYSLTQKLIVSYDDAATEYSTSSAMSCKGNVYSALIIPKGFTININSGGSIVVAALLDYNMSITSSASTTRGVVMNNGTINLSSGTSITSYGYIKGSGVINMASGSSLTDGISIYDFPGGTAATQVWNVIGEKNFPMKSWSLHHNACKTVIASGSTYKSFTYMYLSDTVVFDTFTIIGSSGNYLFKINSGNMVKYAEGALNGTGSDALTNITGSNQIRGQKDVFEINGDVVDGKLAVPIKIIINVTLEANTDRIMGIGFMDLRIKSGNLTVSQTSYAFLPGSSITIDRGATMTIESNSKFAFIDADELSNISFTCVDKVDAYIEVNGTLNVKGYISGLITTSQEGATLNITGNTSTSFKLFKSSSTVLSLGYSATGPVYSSATSFDLNYLAKTTYRSTGNAWCNTSNGTITYDSMGGNTISSETITVINGSTVGYKLDNLPTPVRTGYTFEGWYFDKTYTSGNEALGKTIYGNITLYAKWTINQYTITFDTAGGTSIDSITLDYGTSIPVPADPTKDDYIFAGWDKEIPTTMPAENMTITATWISNEFITYTITFNTNGGSNINPIVAQAGTAITAPANPIKTGYTFAGWDKEIPTTMPEENVTITALWTVNQYTITFNTDGGSSIGSITQDYGSAITAPAYPTKTGYTFAGWDKEIPTTMPAENMIITAEWTINYYTVTFNGNGGTVNGQSSFSIPYNTTFADNGYSLPTASKADGGYIADKLKGWYTATSGGTQFTTSTKVVSDITLYAQWENECIVEGTLILMADGTQKPIEQLVAGDKVLVFNHETGKVEESVLVYNVHSEIGYDEYEVIRLYFSDGTSIGIHGEHYFFDLDFNKYVSINADNVHQFVNHRFFGISYNQDNGTYLDKIVTLESYTISKEYTRVFGPTSAYHLNYFAEGILNANGDNDPFLNIFEYDESMKYDEDQKQADIEKYGLFTYEDFKDYITEDIYNAYNGQYLKVAIGKGYTTFERILELIEKYLVNMGYGDDYKENSKFEE